MLSSEYFQDRWAGYKSILNRGESPASCCHVNVRQLPLRMAGEDATEYIPYALHSGIIRALIDPVQRLQEYMVRYMIKGENVSAHQLPQPDAVSRAMIRHLRKHFPHLPVRLLHHWCADEQGGAGLYRVLNGIWRQSWKQNHEDSAPWGQAVNILVLKLLRSATGQLPAEHVEQTDHVMMSVLGGMYLWAVRRFLKKYVEDALDATRIAICEVMMIPMTPMTFSQRQPEDALLGDTRHMIAAYGLEPDILPRMRELRSSLGPEHEADMLPLLSRDRMDDHLLKRSWARLSIRDMAEKSGQGGWMRFALDAKRLDRLLAAPGTAGRELMKPLQFLHAYPFATWLLDQITGGRSSGKASPWQHDEITLNAFRVFDEDVTVESARRHAERRWQDRRDDLADAGRGSGADHTLEKAYRDGHIIFLQTDFSQPLHCGKGLSSKQACLRVEWSDYLAGMARMYGPPGMQDFMERSFSTGVLRLLEDGDGIFLDEFSASGCLLRGPVVPLMRMGIAIRGQLWGWYQDIVKAGRESMGKERNMPPVSMCMAMTERWYFTRQRHETFGDRHIAFSPGIMQVASGVSRDYGLGALIACRDRKNGLVPLGNVRVECVDVDANNRVRMLYNNGFAITTPALTEWISSIRHKADVREYHVDAASVGTILRGYRLPDGPFDLAVIDVRGEETPPIFIVRAGKLCLGGMDIEIHEVLDPASKAVDLIAGEELPRRANHLSGLLVDSPG